MIHRSLNASDWYTTKGSERLLGIVSTACRYSTVRKEWASYIVTNHVRCGTPIFHSVPRVTGSCCYTRERHTVIPFIGGRHGPLLVFL